MTRQNVLRLLAVLLVLLLVGTQMPGTWRNVLEQSVYPSGGLSSWGHFCIFVVMAFLARRPALCVATPRVLLAALALALLTEGMQFLAIDRHPGWVDVGIDMAGTVVGLLVARMVQKAST